VESIIAEILRNSKNTHFSFQEETMINGQDQTPVRWKSVDWPVFGVSGGIVLIFVIAALINLKFVSGAVNASFAFSCKYFGAYWQVLLLATFVIAVLLAFSKYGGVKLGDLEEPEMSTFRWIAVIMCTLLAGGGVFWSAAEPMYHFITTPPAFPGIESGTKAAVSPALAQAYLHWGFLAWAILGALSTIVLMYAHYHKGLALKPRALLYPVFGEKIMAKGNWWGILADAFSIIAVAAGTIGPIGFLGLQLSFAFQDLFGIPDVYVTQFLIIVGLVIIYTISAITGIYKGIQILSRFNVFLTIILIALILLVGPGGFIIDSFLSAFGTYLREFPVISLYRGDAGWLGWWTVFFWGWFLGYGPMMAVFIARISRGRSIREIVVAVAIIAPVVTNFWFSVLGGAGIYYELAQAGVVSGALKAAGLPAALLAIVKQLPMQWFMIPAFLVLIVIFLCTTGDSMAFTIAVAITGEDNPSTGIRIFWAVMMGAVAAILLLIGSGGISALQSFIVVTAVPVGFILLPPLWGGPKLAKTLYQEQNGISAP
jgi:glycine betaine transporter